MYVILTNKLKSLFELPIKTMYFNTPLYRAAPYDI